MTELTSNFLSLLFDKGETICVSPNKYGYSSIEQGEMYGPITLVSPNEDYGPKVIQESDINLIAVNPIKGWRKDENVIRFRSFMVEIDSGTLEEQKKYIEESKLPWSICIFSGNKSLHYAITLDEPMPNIDMWRFYNQWLLNVLPKTDQQIKNPSRSIRFPGNKRKNGKQLVQALVEMRTRISQEQFFKWLFDHEDKKPIQKRERYIPIFVGIPEHPKDAMNIITQGVDVNRNASWFYIGCRFAEVGFSIDYTLTYLQRHFQEEASFKTREWEGCIKSAYKRIQGDAHVEEN